jgi:hypothetical protein
MKEQMYHTRRVFKDGSPSRIVEENLTREEAKERVAEDIENNPDADYYMLVFDKMEGKFLERVEDLEARVNNLHKRVFK